MNTVTPTAARVPADIGPKVDATPERSFWQRAFGDDGLTFSSLLDVINPLQHIPVVSTIYREVTGDTIAPGAKLIGDTLFGGPIGLALSAVDVTVQGETGKDMGQHVVAMFKPNSTTDSDTAIAAAGTGSTGVAKPSIAWNEPPSEKAAEDTTPARVASAAPISPAPPAETLDPPKPVQVSSLMPRTAAPADDPGAYVPRSAFVAAAMKPRTPGNGVNGAFVALETRSTIAPPAMFAPVSLSVPMPRDDTMKPTDKKVVALPDAKSVAADPKMLQSLRVNGARPAAAQNPSRGPSVTVPMPPAFSPLATPAAIGTAGNDSSNEVADVMARNLERYMAMRNRRPAPTRVDAAF